MNEKQIENFKKKLEEEKTLLESELDSVAEINPDNPKDWIAKPVDQDILRSDENELGDKFEEDEENEAILAPLEDRYNNVKKALDKIADNKNYGICEICGKQIELDRLEANPAAETCKEHMGK